MIISKTPYRISFFGGGSDYPQWFNKQKGAVLSATIDKYIYISCRRLPKFFDHSYRIVWSKIENVNHINQITHRAVRESLKYLKFQEGLEIHYDGDLPARSGIASSSSFVVGLLHNLFKFKNKNISKKKLYEKSIHFEHNILKEVVGIQDQIAVTSGGFNEINFYKKKIKINPIKINKTIKSLNKNLLLIYTGTQRTAQEIASKYVNKLNSFDNFATLKEIVSHVGEAKQILNSNHIDDFGKLLNESWNLKKSLSKAISNKKIDELYNLCLENGALGGKLLGAGGGGFMIIYLKHGLQKKFLKKYKKIINIPFKFESQGSNIILHEK